MFKFARYFFVVFLITTVIPLVLMLLWDHYQMDNMRQEREQHLFNFVSRQLEFSIKQYLDIKENIISDKIHNIQSNKISLKQLQKILNTKQIKLISTHNIVNKTSYYEIIKSKQSSKPELYSVVILPFSHSGINGIKIWEKVDYNQLRPPGPFDVEIYLGNKIEKKSLLKIARSHPFFPPPPPLDFHKMEYPQHHFHDMINEAPMPPPDSDFHNIEYKRTFLPQITDFPEDKIITYNNVKITNNNGKQIVTLLIRMGKLPELNHIDNKLGVIIFLAGSALSIAVGFYINKNFINPILLLSAASQEIQKGNLSFKLETNIKQEQILNTFNNFNKMIKELNEKEKLRKSYITNLTHDLRTPLIAQERCLEFITKKFKNLDLNDEYELAKSLENNNKHLLRMVNLILESYGFDSENLNLVISDINLFELVNDCVTNLTPLISEKNIRFSNDISKDFPLIKGDLTSFKRIFLNLISNAIENISKDNKIQINAHINENFINIFIKDNGTGIAQEDLAHIFDRYYTGRSFERKIGSGLGLDVCRKLIEIHNGEISVESQLNKYTKFIIKLPLNTLIDKER